LATIDPTFVSLFSGVGGLDIGLEQAGWNCAYASDNDPVAVATLVGAKGRKIEKGKTAFDGAHLEHVDVRRLTAPDLLSKAALRKGDVSLLAGGPPCQSWSSAGSQLGFEDPRGRLFDDFIRLARGVDARWLLLENVRGLLTARGPDGVPGSALAAIRTHLLKAGFQTAVSLLNAADYGVAQRRVRLFLIGFREGDAPAFPAATHSKRPDLERRHEWVSMRSALLSIGPIAPDEIIRPSEKLAAQFSGIPDGHGIKSPGKSERTRPAGHWGYKQGCFIADLDQPARTVTASTQQDWIRDPKLGLRRLCPRECAAIQSFPLGWSFGDGLSSQYRLIGNAVPPAIARAIGASLLAHNRTASARIADQRFDSLLPLPSRLDYHIRYTAREEASNGASRRAQPKRRALRATANEAFS
jgi:DNA (cytosine-5)-methyltransferase 1